MTENFEKLDSLLKLLEKQFQEQSEIIKKQYMDVISSIPPTKAQNEKVSKLQKSATFF